MTLRVTKIEPHDGRKSRRKLKSHSARDEQGRAFQRVTWLYLDGTGGLVTMEYEEER